MFALIFPALALIGAAVHLIVTKAPRTRERVADVLLLYVRRSTRSRTEAAMAGI